MWLAFFTGWIVGSATLYSYMVFTAREPQRDECMDCTLSECIECPYAADAATTSAKRKAA